MASVTDSPAQLSAATARARLSDEGYLRELEGLSEEDLRAIVEETVALETAAMEEWLRSDDCYIVSLAGKVHLPGCESMRRFVDRRAAWSSNLRWPDRLLGPAEGEDPVPPWPLLRTRAQLDAMPRRTACPLCRPALAHLDEPRAAVSWTYLPARSLRSRHFGTEFRLASGTVLGALVRISSVETIAGLEFSAEFEQAEAPVTDPDTELMYRTGTRAKGA